MIPNDASDRWQAHRASLVAAAVVAWVIGIILGLTAAGDGVLAGDVRVARWVQRVDGRVVDRVADFGNWVGAYWTGVAISVLVAIPLGIMRRWREIALLMTVIVIRALNTTVKGWIESPRPPPDLVRVTENADCPGFPSGHASGAMLVFGALAWICWTNIRPHIVRRFACAICLALVATVGFARISTGAHWPSDVLGGYVLGIAILSTMILAIGRLERMERRPWSS